MRRILIVAFATAALMWAATPASADVIDLLDWGSTATVTGVDGNGSSSVAWVYQAGIAPVGSGVINSFVRIAGTDIEQGYNTDARPVQFDENTSPTFTHSLLLTAVGQLQIDGYTYYEFGLDINQNNNDPGLVLDDVIIFQYGTGSYSGNVISAFPNVVWEMDGAVDNEILLNFNAGAGSGKGDMYLYVRDDLFDTNLPFVYLYSHFGGINTGTSHDPVQGAYPSGGGLDTGLTCLSYDFNTGELQGAPQACGDWFNNDGYEEWFVRETTTVVPEPASLMLMGTGLIGIAGALRRRHSRRK